MIDRTVTAVDAADSLRFVDTHTHLDDPAFDADRDVVIARSNAAGVRRMVNVGYAPARWQSTIALAATRPDIAFSLGLHPGHADEWTDGLLADLEVLARKHPVVAIGEIGLDFAHETPDPALQHRVFEAQLDLARALGLPVVIHQRAAGSACAEVLGAAVPDQHVVLHSFDGNGELLALGLARGWIFGVGGLMTRKSSEELRLALMTIPLDRIVLESDCPYLVPRGMKSRRNTPESIPHIADALAALLHQPVYEVAAITTATAEGMFGRKGRQDDA